MPYFVRVGRIEANKSRVGSRGWYVRRSGKTIVVRWGAVDVVPAGGQVRFYWARGWPQDRHYSRPSVESAVAFMRDLIASKTRAGKHDGGYDRLPFKQPIRIRPAST